MLGHSNTLTSSGDSDWDRRAQLTSPGQPDWVDLEQDRRCRDCRFFKNQRCNIFIRIMRRRLRQPVFKGPKLPPGQRACRRFAASDRHNYFHSPSTKGDDPMAKVSKRYRKSFLSADDVETSDLTLRIAGVDFDEVVNDKEVDIVRFADDDRKLILNAINARTIAKLYGDETDGWIGKTVTLFLDENVTYQGQHTPGIRVRDHVPPSGNGPVPQSSSRDKGDDIPF
jgi:hypothetical protein